MVLLFVREAPESLAELQGSAGGVEQPGGHREGEFPANPQVLRLSPAP